MICFLANRGPCVGRDGNIDSVVDGQTAGEGSFNYTAAAESKNAENALVLHDPVIAWQYEHDGCGCGTNRRVRNHSIK
jgi:hypothetical protein